MPAHQHLIRGRVAQERRDPAKALAEFERGAAALAGQSLGPLLRRARGRGAGRLRSRARGVPRLHPRSSRALPMRATPRRGPAAGRGQPERRPRDAANRGSTTSRWRSRVSCWECAWRASPASTTGVARILRDGSRRTIPCAAATALAAAADGLAERSSPALAVEHAGHGSEASTRDPALRAGLARARALLARGGSERRARTPASRRSSRPTRIPARSRRSAASTSSSPGAPKAGAAAYARALELDPEKPQALAALGQAAPRATIPRRRSAYFDRAAAADPNDPASKLGAAKALVASGKSAEAEQRLDALLREHPSRRPPPRSAPGSISSGSREEQTLERARRAVRFGGGADALELLSRVLTSATSPSSPSSLQRARAASAKPKRRKPSRMPQGERRKTFLHRSEKHFPPRAFRPASRPSLSALND